MKTSLFSYLKISKQNLWKSLTILVIGLVVTAISTEFSVEEARSDAEKEFKLICSEIKSVLSVRLHANAGFLRSGAALFSVDDSVTRKDWANFYAHSNIQMNLPGIQGIGYAELIPKSELQHHIESMRAQGFPNYSVKPEGDRAIYSSVIYLEPFIGRNLRAFSYDMLSEPVRRKAMELSRDSNLAVLSGKVTLKQETEKDVQAGTLMFVPVYSNDMPTSTVEQRRAAIKGWVYSPYRMTELMQGVLGEWNLYQQKNIRLQVYDNNTLTSKSLLYDSWENDMLSHSDSHSRKTELPVDFNGKRWLLSFSQSDPYNLYLEGEALTVMLSGILLSLLLFFLSYSLFSTRYRAQWIADKLTKELKESEEKYRTDFVLLQTIVESPDSIIIFALDTNYCYLSFTKFHKITMKQIWGADIVLGMNMLPLLTNPDDRQKAKNNFDRAIQGERFVLTEEYGDNALSRNYYEDYYSPIKDAEGNIIGVSVFVVDISERKKAEETISMLAHAIRSISECVSITDVEDKIIFVNKALLQTYNYEESEIIDKHISIVRSPNNSSDIVAQILPSTLQGGWNGELLNRKKDGTEFPVFVSTSAICDETGNPIALIGIARDITKDKQAQEELHESEKKHRLLTEFTADVIWVLNLSQNKFTYISPSVFRLRGYTAEEAMNETLAEALTPESVIIVKKAIAENIPSFIEHPEISNHYMTELQQPCKDGQIIWVEVSTQYRYNTAGEIEVVGVSRNIDERKQTHEDMLEMNKELSNYLRVIAHDLRSPLVGVQGYAMRYGKQTEALKTVLANIQLEAADKEKLDKITFEDMPKTLKTILDSVDKMEALLKGLSRISNTGQTTLLIKKINMNELFNAIVSTHNFHMEEQGAQINIADLLDCYGDENLLNQLFSNIMGNALKYRDPLRPLIIEVTSKTHHHRVTYSIKDSGIGIPDNRLGEIWNVFFRVNPKSTVTGEGIGLSFVKRIADKHKGRIWAESTLGVGSTFHVELQRNEFSE